MTVMCFGAVLLEDKKSCLGKKMYLQLVFTYVSFKKFSFCIIYCF